MKIRLLAAIVVFLLHGCASMDGRGLVPGQSTTKDVETLMGAPTERMKMVDGNSTWFYSLQPTGRMMYAVRFSPDGVMRSREQLLTEQNLTRLARDTTTREQARAMFGPPWKVANFERQGREVWEYFMFNVEQYEYLLYLQFSNDGILREVMMLKDYAKEPGGDSGKD